MDLKKIKYLFIVGFLLLDLFLLYVLIDQNRDVSLLQDGQGRTTNGGLVEDINLQFSPTDEVNELTMRSAHRDRLDDVDNASRAVEELRTDDEGYRLTGRLAAPITLNEAGGEDPYVLEDGARDALDQWLAADSLPYAEDYVFGFYDPQRREIYYGQKVDENNLFLDSTAELIFHVDGQNRISSFELTHVSDIKSEGPAQRMVTMTQAINNLSVSGRFVQGMTLYQAMNGYQDMFTVDDIVVYRPIWLLLGEAKAGDLNQFYVDGIKGNIVRNENDPNEPTAAENAEEAAEESTNE